MTRFDPGDIVLIQFPYTDNSTTKRRPALVLSPLGYIRQRGDLVLLAMTSQPQAQASLRLASWKLAGLPKPTWLKPVIGTFASSLVLRRIARLQESDYARARLALRNAISPDFLK